MSEIVEPFAFESTFSNGSIGQGVSPTVTVGSGLGIPSPPAIAFTAKDYGADAGEIAPTLRAGTHDTSHANGGVMPAVSIHTTQDPIHAVEVSAALGTGTSTGFGSMGVQPQPTAQVRRLTCEECERLQGWPTNHTRWRADGTENSDSTRYRMIGNGVAAPVAQWLAERITQLWDTQQ